MRKEVHRRYSILLTDDNTLRMASVELDLGDAGGSLDGQPTTGYTNRQRNQSPIDGIAVSEESEEEEDENENDEDQLDEDDG